MKVTLPYPPSANRYWRTFRGRAVLSAEAKAYKKQVAALLAAAGHKPVSGPVAYTAHIYRPLRSGDLDNRLKVLGDALTGFAWLDDKQVEEIHAYRHEDKANPRVEIEVRALGVEGVLEPLTPAEAWKKPVRDLLHPAQQKVYDRIRAGHVVTPDFQREHTEAVVPKKRAKKASKAALAGILAPVAADPTMRRKP